MSTSGDILASGALPALAEDDIYAANMGVTTIKQIRLVNTHASSARTVYVRVWEWLGGSYKEGRKLTPSNLTLDPGDMALLLDNDLILGISDKISGEDVGGVGDVDYTITGEILAS